MTNDTPGATPKRESRPTRGWAVWLALAIAVFSLMLNAFLIFGLLGARDVALQTVTSSLEFMDDFKAQGLEFKFPISHTLHIDQDIPLQLDLNLPIDTQLPVNMVITVPVELGLLGTRQVVVPINTKVPVRLNVPVHIDKRFPLRLPVSIRFTVPVRLDPDQPPLRYWLALAREKLLEVRQQISGGSP